MYTTGSGAPLAHWPERSSEEGEQGHEDQEDGMGCQAGCKVPTEGLLAPVVPLLATRARPLELQFWDDPMDPVMVGGDPDIDTWAVPAGAALTPAGHPSLQP